MLQLKLYPAEFSGMLLHLYLATNGQQNVPLRFQGVLTMQLLEYEKFWNPERIHKWKMKNPRREYSLSLKPLIALSLYRSLLSRTELKSLEQLFLAKLDKAIVNYQTPSYHDSDHRVLSL